ncbi:MAG TPA: FkbM family methyltransferase [Egicoccus sp.]|nr:FkbM family methyltransferase [Egicoccus sp.]HSK22160.1 FkbM family methyltransferase [Egicoccus sp.]
MSEFERYARAALRRARRLQRQVVARRRGPGHHEPVAAAEPAPKPTPSRSTPVQRPMLTRRRFTTTLPAPAGTPPLPPLAIEAPLDAYVPERLEKVGLAGYEPDTLAAWCTALEQRPQGLVYDIGANIGVFALTAGLLVRAGLTPRHELIAIEPTPDLVEVARALLGRNHLDAVVLACAFGRERTTATFHLSDKSDASSSLNEKFRPSTRKIEVAIERLDDEVAARGGIPTLLKIDTETTEPDVLEGGMATVERHRPWMICEVLPGRGAEERLQPMLDGLGYRTYRLDGGAAASEGPLAGDTEYTYLNWLLAPEAPDAAFWSRTAAWRDAWR